MSEHSTSFLDLGVALRIAKAYANGVRSVFTSPSLLALLITQVVIALVSYIVLAYFAFSYRNDITATVTGTVDSWWEYIISWLVFLILLALNGIAAYIVATIVGAFVLEWFAQILLKQLGAPVDEELSILAISRMLKRTAIFTVYRLLAGTVALTLSLLALFFPPLGVVSMMLLVFLLGVDMLELPTSMLEPDVRSRIHLVRNHKPELFWFGLIATGIFAIPFVGILFLPLVCSGAVHTVFDLYRRTAPAGS